MSRPPRDPEKILQRLEWTVLRRLDGILQGDYRTLFRGFGLDLAGLREYQIGDDVRHIDWNVTARLAAPYVRQYNEDREITAWFLLDVSPSVDFGTELSKRDMLTDFVTVLAALLARRGNRTGAVLDNGERLTVIPPRGGRQHVLHLTNSLVSMPNLEKSPQTDLRRLVDMANRIVHRRSLIFIVSDFFSAPGWEGPLVHLAQRHEALAVRLFDPLELEIPDLGFVLLRDAETGEHVLVNAGDGGFKRRFAEEMDRHETEIRDGLRQAGIDCLEIGTQDDLVDALVRFIHMRKQRAMLASGRTPEPRRAGRLQ